MDTWASTCRGGGLIIMVCRLVATACECKEKEKKNLLVGHIGIDTWNHIGGQDGCAIVMAIGDLHCYRLTLGLSWVCCDQRCHRHQESWNGSSLQYQCWGLLRSFISGGACVTVEVHTCKLALTMSILCEARHCWLSLWSRTKQWFVITLLRYCARQSCTYMDIDTM